MSTPTFLARSLAAWLRLGASFTARMPWSVQPRDMMNIGMESSCGARAGAPLREQGTTCWLHDGTAKKASGASKDCACRQHYRCHSTKRNLGTFRVKGSSRKTLHPSPCG